MTRESGQHSNSGSCIQAVHRYRMSSVAIVLGVFVMVMASGCSSPSASPPSVSPPSAASPSVSPPSASPAIASPSGDTPVVSGTGDPFQAQKEAIDSLALEQSVEFVNSKLGVPEESHALCSKISSCSQDTSGEPLLNIYRDEHYTVRAVFDANSLNLFAVTMESGQFKPRIRWLYDLGALGEFTYEEASAADGIQPAAVIVHMGPRSSAYAEIVSVGAPGHYQGLMLGWAPDGFGNLPWDIEGAGALNTKQISSSDQQALLAAAGPFRAGSVPNTVGLFLDDGGTMSELLHDPQNAISILYTGTHL
jgi:hypothetical protein